MAGRGRRVRGHVYLGDSDSDNGPARRGTSRLRPLRTSRFGERSLPTETRRFRTHTASVGCGGEGTADATAAMGARGRSAPRLPSPR